jgi:hypothetical protein
MLLSYIEIELKNNFMIFQLPLKIFVKLLFAVVKRVLPAGIFPVFCSHGSASLYVNESISHFPSIFLVLLCAVQVLVNSSKSFQVPFFLL